MKSISTTLMWNKNVINGIFVKKESYLMFQKKKYVSYLRIILSISIKNSHIFLSPPYYNKCLTSPTFGD